MSNLLRLVSLNAARVLFVGGLLLALYVGLTWALAVEDRPDAGAIAAAEAAREAAQSESEAAASDAPSVTATPEPTPGLTTTPPPATVDPQELIAAARPPAETTVQILDAGGGNALVDAVRIRLEEIGYQIIAVQESSRRVDRTTVYFTEENQAQAEGLRARDPRFQVVEANRGLSRSVDIHVLVGPNF